MINADWIASAALVLGAGTLLLTGCVTRPHGPVPGQPGTATRQDFSYGYWLNGWRKPADGAAPDILCLETGHYAFALDIADLSTARFGLLDDDADYERSLAAGAQRLDALQPAKLAVELELDGKTYRAVRAPRKGARMWESGRIAQHFDLLDLRFVDEAGNQLPCFGRLDVVAWPGSLTFTAELAPDLLYTDGPCQGVVGSGLCIVDKPLDIPHSPELEPEKLTAECWVNIPERMNPKVYGWMLCKNDHEWGEGNYGLMWRNGRAVAVLNNVGGRDKQQMIAHHGGLEQGKWHHFALTYDGATMRFYVDGREHGNKAISEPRTRGNGILRIGKRADGNFGVVNGLYDQVRIWNRALTADELRAHAAKPNAVANRDGLVFEETFDAEHEFEAPVWHNARVRIGFEGSSLRWQDEALVTGAWKMGEKKSVSLNCDLTGHHMTDGPATVRVSASDDQQFPVRFDPAMNCYAAVVKGLKRSFRGGYVKITDYDEFDIVLDCPEHVTRPVPFLLDFRNPANITGLVPILCHADGTPTGVHVQLSKNWHYRPMGAYLRAYMLLPVKPGQNRYRLRIPYGFYGTLPSASHGQLCLIGYGGNQRWDQLALACGGESITFDADMSLTNVAVCDVRTPLGRAGKDGNTWGWTDAGWGGDWLGVHGADDWKLTFTGMKTAYLAHGPCLSDVLYKGAYGSDRDVLVDARVQLPRTDDYGRTFQHLTYRFQRELDAANSYLLRRHARAFDSLVAYGNADGLIAEKRVTANLKKGDLLIPPTELTGPGPWWVAFPERDSKPTGYVSLIIRDYAACFGGTLTRNPFLMARVEKREGDKASLETWFVPPPDVDTYKPGDWVTLDTEWVHLVTEADKYGGPNDAYRQHLAQTPRSWKTTHREVVGNTLDVEVKGGELLQRLPIVVRATEPKVTVTIQGGVGHVPIRFEGLRTADGYALYEQAGFRRNRLDQSVHGNDYWQTDYDARTNTYKMTFNLPLDGKATSTWVLKR